MWYEIHDAGSQVEEQVEQRVEPRVSTAGSGRPKRVYVIEGDEDQLDEFERFLGGVSWCCSVGASRNFKLFVDGDGAANLHIERKEDKRTVRLEGPTEDEDRAEELQYSFGC